jgi:hypothetical protein
MTAWNPEPLIKIWSEEIESIEVDGYKRKILYTDNNIIGIQCPEYHITFNLDYLKKDNKEIDDYSNKLYSIWGFKVINIFTDKLKCEEGITSNSNWTEITFKNDYADFIYYNRFTFKVSLFDYLKVLRDEKLKLLGL